MAQVLWAPFVPSPSFHLEESRGDLSSVLVQREWDKRLCSLREWEHQEDCEWIYRFGANPGAGVRAASCCPSGLGLGSALRPRPRVALSSAQALSVYITAPVLIYLAVLGLGSPLGIGCCQFLSPCRPDCLGTTGQLVRWDDVGDCAVQPDGVVLSHKRRNEPSSVFQAQWGCDANAACFQSLVPPFHLPITIMII